MDCEGCGAFWIATWRCQRARGYKKSEVQRELPAGDVSVVFNAKRLNELFKCK